MLKRPLFLISTAFSAGILALGTLHLPFVIVAAGLIFSAAAATAKRRFVLSLLLVIALVGAFRYHIHMTLPPDDVSRFIGTAVSSIQGCVISDIDIRDDRAMYILSVQELTIAGRRTPASGRLMVVHYKPTGKPDWQPPDYGNLVLIRSRLSRPPEASNPGAFAWKDYLVRKRIHAVTYITKPYQIQVVRQSAGNPVTAAAYMARDRLAETVDTALPADEASVVTGMALGTYTTLPDRLLSNFTRTGTLHLMAASGFNCVVLVIAFNFLLARILKFPKKHVHVILIGILVFYMLMVGTKPSIVRATLMASLLLFGVLINRPADTINLLFAAALIILMINPADIYDIGFQLSFSAVMALVVVFPAIEMSAEAMRVNPLPARRQANIIIRAAAWIFREGWQGLLTTVAATLGTIPLIVYYFNYLSLVSFLANVVVAATVLPIFVIGLLLPVVGSVPLVGDILAIAGTAITRFSLASINWFGELPNSCIYMPSPGTAGVIGYYILLAAGLWYVRSKFKGKTRAHTP
ncbi:MAG TPA: ComEC/Rec2 family competence protein [Armatimonadota bacterium]|nr:ComEC/Rec2 family competence protein [Armatimonadota bacterium]